MPLPSLSLVIGGASSGKSAFAERLVRHSDLAKVYLATAQAFDADMQARIEAHRKARAGQGWRTVEAPLEVAPALATLETEEIALVDCATLWLSNVMLAGLDWADQADQLIEVMLQTEAPVVVVSNEVGQGIVPDTRLGRDFRDAQGRMNQHMAAKAGLVVQVTVGLPHVLKGALPGLDTPW
ncbi:bifunctional adenosylcobinamide kinase/adenosylcobinamide-phosphate guanylyltransferase [Rhodophyticola sp. CCM32]|uniref:bifunctional adenosylcobinamide kinase/adenosylcobinamide-phosphate guanylyltransferase n=1 Tax=Rhodophyticola sp. CCM32 TaxID=2916397 RepID=UPI00107F7C7A|nr:bifunctional adenosylcobinamide kinase/adenosylcobinamide-phosphate guanylyltransferase [Rhodophyticola sp. CCM32]QBX99625.1 bifunctional adenosylcobinamide kinase/adenosylcobinamide-phosphate guanylyltransferase [Rhodophyticola sp. CCM32]